MNVIDKVNLINDVKFREFITNIIEELVSKKLTEFVIEREKQARGISYC